MARLIPGAPVPRLAAPLAGGGEWNIADSADRAFTVVEFYRGLHCPLCSKRLPALQESLDELDRRDAGLVAVSMDGKERAEQAKADWKLDRLAVAYGLAEEDARAWGLYISASIAEKEPRRFCEPGQFVVRSDGTLYVGCVATAPFLRPSIDGLLRALDMAIDRDYPPRGTLG
ncbi:MAG TPA: redoxin domain-containing protein [Alphaproteobacteria bacterium]|nr:redoxin domain-containing protein [Alphaproteobacteria bacterium]